MWQRTLDLKQKRLGNTDLIFTLLFTRVCVYPRISMWILNSTLFFSVYFTHTVRNSVSASVWVISSLHSVSMKPHSELSGLARCCLWKTPSALEAPEVPDISDRSSSLDCPSNPLRNMPEFRQLCAPSPGLSLPSRPDTCGFIPTSLYRHCCLHFFFDTGKGLDEFNIAT